MKLIKYKEPLILFSFFLLAFILKFHTLHLALFWDEIAVYGGPIFEFYNKGFSYFKEHNANFSHPYGLTLIIAGLFKVFGAHLFVMRTFCVFMASLTMYGIYVLLGGWKKVWISIGGALIFFFVPEVFVQSSMIVGDNILTAYAIFYLALIYRQKYLWAILVGLLMGFTRETAIAFTPMVIIYLSLQKRLSLKSVAASLSPIVSLSLFYLYQKWSTQNYISHQAVTEKHISFDRNFNEVISFMKHHLEQIFYERGKTGFIYITAFSIIALIVIKLLKKEKIQSLYESMSLKFILPTIIIFLTFILFFSFHSMALIRYFLPLIPFIVMVCVYFMGKVHKFLPLVSLLFMIPFQFWPHYKFNECNRVIATGQEHTMEYVQVIEVHRMGAQFIEDHYNSEDILVCSGWPVTEELKQSYVGYLDQDAHFKTQHGFSKDCDLYVWANNMSRDVIEMKEPLLKNNQISLVKNFEHYCKSYEVYETPSYRQQ